MNTAVEDCRAGPVWCVDEVQSLTLIKDGLFSKAHNIRVKSYTDDSVLISALEACAERKHTLSVSLHESRMNLFCWHKDYDIWLTLQFTGLKDDQKEFGRVSRARYVELN